MSIGIFVLKGPRDAADRKVLPSQVRSQYLCLLSALLLLIMVPSGCASVKTVSTEIYQDDRIQVTLVERLEKTGERVTRGFDHPWAVDQVTLNALLGSIYHKRDVVFYKGKPKEAFPLPARHVLLEPLQKAFAQANPDQEVEFSFRHRKSWAVLFSRDLLTDGLLFRKGGELNCAFRHLAFDDSVDVETGSGAGGSSGDPTEKPFRTDWILEPGDGQRLIRQENGGWLRPKVFSNWIALDLSHSWEDQEEPTEEVKVALPPEEIDSRHDIEGQLDLLDQLLKEGLLTEAAYEKKRMDLLDRLKALPPEGEGE